MKLLHTSDWHLGMTFRNGISYADDQRFFIEKICDIAIEHKVQAIMIAGDIYDKSIASKEAIDLYNRAIEKMCLELEIPVLIIAGNHDGAERLSMLSELLKKAGLYVQGALTKEPAIVNLGDTDIFMLPWITTDKVKTIYTEEADNINTIEDAYQIVLDKYRERFIPGHKNILMSHAFIVNAETSVSDRAAEVGRATMVSAKVFEGFDYVALGHIHGPQQINDRIRYSGTPMPYSFGKEEKQQKSVTIIDTDTFGQEIVPLPLLNKRNTLRGSYEELLKANYDNEVIDGYVRLEVTDTYVGIEAMSALREIYKNLLEIAGKSLEREDAEITMTIEEYEQVQMDPQSVFGRFCEDILEEKPSEHLMSLFNNAVRSYEKEALD